jgi:probable HAF family extracellular repeat protein
LSTGFYRAFVYRNGHMTNLGTLGGNYSAAYAINKSSQVVGESATSANLQHAFPMGGGVMTDLGTLGGTAPSESTLAYGINDSGTIVGYSYLPDGNFHGFVYSQAKMTDIGALYTYSSGLAINNSGAIVGSADIRNNTGYEVYHAVIFEKGKPVDLNTLIPAGSAWVLTSATSINAGGAIVGYGQIGGVSHGFLLTPQ